jgi:TPR repeat protein
LRHKDAKQLKHGNTMKRKLEPNTQENSKEYFYETKEDAAADFGSALKEIANNNFHPDILSRLEKSKNELVLKHLIGANKLITIIKNSVTADSQPTLLKNLEDTPNDSAALNYLKGFLYNHRLGTADNIENLQKAKECYEKAADQSDAVSQFNLGMMYLNGKGVKQDYTEAIRWFTKATEQGYAPATLYIGEIYFSEKSGMRDYVEATKWLTKAAEQGYALAQYKLGLMYRDGKGVERDYTEAKKWFTKAAEQEYANAQYNLCIMYVDERDYTEAIKWLTKAAEHNNAYAQYSLGVMYADGKGVAQSFTEAKKWLTKAAEQGHGVAQYYLGFIYAQGQGEPNSRPNIIEAKKWLAKASEQGYGNAQLKLGLMYAEQKIQEPLMEVCQWFCKTFKNVKGGRNLTKEAVLTYLQKSFSDYISKQTDQDLTDALVNMKYVITPEDHKTLGRFFQPHIKDYYNTYHQLFENIAKLPNGEKIFSYAKEIQKAQRKDLFNFEIFIQGAFFPAEVYNLIFEKLPTAGVPIQYNKKTAEIISQSLKLKGAIPEEQDRTTYQERVNEEKYTNIYQYGENQTQSLYQETTPEKYLEDLSKSRKEFFSKSILERIIDEQKQKELAK